MRITIMVAAAALAGCQSMSVDQLRAQAPYQPDIKICRALVRGNPTMQQLAAEEQQRRKLDCTPHMAILQAEMQNDANQAALGMQLLNASRPQPVLVPQPAFPQPISCSSRNVMGTVYTDCR